MKTAVKKVKQKDPAPGYRLDEQVGFILRRVFQRHTAIFSGHMVGDLTPTQFSTLVRLDELRECSQNRLGRLVSMDAATTNGVVLRLGKRGFVTARPDPHDRRQLLVSLTARGRLLAEQAIECADRITRETLLPLSKAEQKTFMKLLSKLDR